MLYLFKNLMKTNDFVAIFSAGKVGLKIISETEVSVSNEVVGPGL